MTQVNRGNDRRRNASKGSRIQGQGRKKGSARCKKRGQKRFSFLTMIALEQKDRVILAQGPRTGNVSTDVEGDFPLFSLIGSVNSMNRE